MCSYAFDEQSFDLFALKGERPSNELDFIKVPEVGTSAY